LDDEKIASFGISDAECSRQDSDNDEEGGL